jgi:hypothetical protein
VRRLGNGYNEEYNEYLWAATLTHQLNHQETDARSHYFLTVARGNGCAHFPIAEEPRAHECRVSDAARSFEFPATCASIGGGGWVVGWLGCWIVGLGVDCLVGIGQVRRREIRKAANKKTTERAKQRSLDHLVPHASLPWPSRQMRPTVSWGGISAQGSCPVVRQVCHCVYAAGVSTSG